MACGIVSEIAHDPSFIPPHTGTRWRLRLLASVAAAVGSLLVNQGVYRNTPVTTDENSYVFQARTFLEGHVARPYPPVAQVFQHEMIILSPQVGWLSRYAPAHALWLLPGVWLGQPRLMAAVAAGLAVWFISGGILLIGGSVGIGCLVLLCSPYFQFMNGTLLSHTSGLATVAILWWAFLSWQIHGSRWHAVVSGLAWAFLFLNRTYTAALLAVPLGIAALVHLGVRWRNPRQWTGTLLFGTCAAVGLGLFLLYNALAVGNPFVATHAFYGDEAAVGFTAGHTWRDGLRDMWGNLRLLDLWLLGSPGSLILVSLAVVIGWSRIWSLVCVGGVASVVVGYSAFSSPGFNTCGPYYYFETLPFLVTFLALAAARLERGPMGRRMVLLFAVAMLIAGGAFMKQETRRTRKDRAADVRAQEALRHAPPGALIFVGGFNETVGRQLLLNERGLRSDPLVVQDWGRRNYLTARTFPDRACYRLRPGMDRVVPFMVPFQKVVCEADAADVQSEVGRLVAGDGTPEPVLVTATNGARAGWLAYGKRFPVLAGRYRVTFRLDSAEVPAATPGLIEVRDADGHRLAQREVCGTSTNAGQVLEFVMPAYGTVEPRVRYGGDGRLMFHGYRIEEQ